VSPRAVNLADKRWAQRANELQFHGLETVRATADHWRTGTAALTTLLSAASIIAAPGLADRLTGGWRIAAGLLALTALLSLLYGTWQAMRAAFGLPDAAVTMTGERLHRWESQQARVGADALRQARLGALTGMLLLIVTAGVTFLGTPSTAGQTARVQVGTTTYCGRIGKGAADGTITVTGRDGTVHTVALARVTTLNPSTAC